MAVRVNGNSQHYTMATLVINHCRGHYLELYVREYWWYSTRVSTTHFWRSFELPIFIHEAQRERKRLFARGKIRKLSAYINVAVICFMCIARYTNACHAHEHSVE